MLVKCICTNCAGHLEFDEVNAGRKIDCPHCGFQTVLFLPGTRPPDPILESLAKRFIRRRHLKWALGAVLVLAALGFALYRWGVPLAHEALPSIQSQSLCFTLVVLSCFLVGLVGLWLALPLFFFFQSRNLLRVLTAIEEDLRSIAEQRPERGLDTAVITAEDVRKL